MLNYSFAKQHGILIIDEQDSVVVLHRPDVALPSVLEVARGLSGPYSLQQISSSEFDAKLTSLYQGQGNSAHQMAQDIGEHMDLSQLMDEMPESTDLLESNDDAPIIKLINALLSEAIKQGASDLHFETYESDLVVRFRIDGVLREVLRPKRVLAPIIVSRIKVMAKLDIAEKRLPQDGRIALKVGGRAVDVRVSTLPTGYGERIVLRVLDKQAGRLDLTELGMDGHSLDLIQQLIQSPHGIMLVTGPTGSGKSTSLYAMLSDLNHVARNILTVEDPIEYNLPGIGQTQVNTKVQMTFAKGLRAILRQDPDVVMVGEIRDLETAEIAVQASLTGHLVLSTLHTNTAVGAITRLRDMGIEPFLLASSMIGVLAQRLVRVLCDACKTPKVLDESEAARIGFDNPSASTIYQAQGCEACNQSGYRGRTGIYEIATIDERVRALINDDQNEASIESVVREHSPSMRSNGFDKVRAGITSIEEVLRVTSNL